MIACSTSEAGIRLTTTTEVYSISLKLTTSRTIVRPSSRRITSMPIGLGAGFAMAPKMAIEAMMKVVFIMDDLILWNVRRLTRIEYGCVKI